MVLSTDTYNGLNKIAAKTGMDCWFSIKTVNKKGIVQDIFYDLENHTELSINDAMNDFIDGITCSLSDMGLTENEQNAVLQFCDAVGFHHVPRN